MKNKPNDARGGAFVSAIALGLGLGAGEAKAQTRETVDVSVGARASTSPFLEASADTESAAVSLSVDPALYFESEVTTANVVGNFRLDQYTNRYGTDASLRLGASGRRILNERMTISASVDASSSRSGAQDFVPLVASNFLPNAAPSPQQNLAETLVPDITGAGSGARLNSYSAQVSLDHVLSPTATVGFGVNGSLTSTSSVLGEDYSTLGFQTNYRQSLSETTWLRGTLQAASFNYFNRNEGDGSNVTALMGIERTLSEKVSFTVQAGGTFTRINGLQDTTEEHVGFALDARLCKQEIRSSLCAAAARNTRPTAFGGVSTVSSLVASYDLETGVNDRLSFSGQYGHTSAIGGAGFPDAGNYDVLAATANYSRELSPRLFAYASPTISRMNSSNQPAEVNFQIELGIRRRFGDQQ